MLSHIQGQFATSNSLVRVELTFQWDLIRSAWDLIHQGMGGCKTAGCLKLESLQLCLFGLPACETDGWWCFCSCFSVLWGGESWWRKFGEPVDMVQHQLLNRLFQDGPTLIQDHQLVWDNWFFISRCCFFFPCFTCDAAVPSGKGSRHDFMILYLCDFRNRVVPLGERIRYDLVPVAVVAYGVVGHWLYGRSCRQLQTAFHPNTDKRNLKEIVGVCVCLWLIRKSIL